MRLALRIEVATDAGLRMGVPALLRLLDEYQIRASFCISLGPDLSVYPFTRALPCWLLRSLPGVSIAHKYRETLLAIAHAGHDVGLSSYHSLEWSRDAAFKSPGWVHAETTRSVDSFVDLFGSKPSFYGALGFQTNAHLLYEEESIGLQFASDVCGRYAFLPELQGIKASCPQIPTTLPLLDELLLDPEINHNNIHQYLYAESQRVLPNGEVFTLSAEREGRVLFSAFEKLLVMWKGSQWEIGSLSDLFEQIDITQLKRHAIGWTSTELGDQYVAMQSSLIGDETNTKVNE